MGLSSFLFKCKTVALEQFDLRLLGASFSNNNNDNNSLKPNFLTVEKSSRFIQRKIVKLKDVSLL